MLERYSFCFLLCLKLLGLSFSEITQFSGCETKEEVHTCLFWSVIGKQHDVQSMWRFFFPCVCSEVVWVVLGFFIVSFFFCTFASNRTGVFVRAVILTEASTRREILSSLHSLSPQQLIYIDHETCKGVGGEISLSFTPYFEEVVQTSLFR